MRRLQRSIHKSHWNMFHHRIRFLSARPFSSSKHVGSSLRVFQLPHRTHHQQYQHKSVIFYRGIASSNTLERLNHYLTNLSPREEMKLEEELLHAISNEETGVIDPVLQRNIRELGWMKEIKLSGNVINMDTNTNKPREEGLKHSITAKLMLPTLMISHTQKLKEDLIRVIQETVWKRWVNHSIKEGNSKSFSDSESALMMQNIKVNVEFNASKPIPFVRNVREHEEVIKKLGPGLANVRHFLAVYSCKGGVGKSTTAVNLAYELSRLGGRVGLLDVDIYGPSLPILVKPDDPAVRKSPIGPGVVKPILHRGVKMLSLGFVSPQSGVPGSGANTGAAVMRGPMAGRVVSQLLKGTEWGELDVLVLDMPPGTGDVQLTVCQELELSGAVSVTTPSKLAAVDAAKGVEMFTSLGVPTLAIVENMSYFDCEGGTRHFPFGKSIKDSIGGLDQTSSNLKESNIFQFPISARLNEANDEGIPLCLSRPQEAAKELDIFRDLSISVSNELLRAQHGKSNSVTDDVSIRIENHVFDVANLHLSSDNANESFLIRFFSDSGATEVRISGEKLRYWHPKLGEPLDIESKDEKVVVVTSHSGCGSHDHPRSDQKRKSRLFPCKIEKKGRYGYQIEWADQATIIYSMYSLAKAAGGTSVK